ncbi:MAG: recombinase family protein [Nocardioidaceae bacterium]|nr:recombinase family protein [Nocardioidaceae bacterium]
MTTHRAALYARISSDDGSALGVGRQIADCQKLAAEKGWTIVEAFVDNDVSASNGKARPEYDRLLAALTDGRADALVVWDIDRLTRTPRELEDVVDLADKHGVALASVGGEVDLATPQGRLTARLKGNVARHEVEQQSRRLKRKFQERAEAGKPHGKVAYGYRRHAVHDDQGRVVGSVELLDEAQAAVVREVARRLLAREPVRRIVAELNTRGVPTPRGNDWDGTMLRQVMLRQRNASRRVHRGEVIGKGDWPPLLDEDTFDRLHAMLTDPSRRTTRGNEVKHLLSGIAKCGIDGCGGTMRVTNARMNGTKHAPTSYNCRKCNRVRRKKVDVDELVEAVLVARLERPDGPDLLAGDPAALRDASERVEALQARLDLAADNYAEGKITGEQMTRITAKLRPQLDDSRARLRAAAPSPDLERFAAGDVQAAWTTADIEVKRAVITMLVEITITPAGSGGRFAPETVQIEWKGEQ